jgi:anti-sigma regulatory factor (Ser/Thr protein kinase)
MRGHPVDELTVRADLECLPEVQDFVIEKLADCPMKILNRISVIIDEIFANIASYAYGQAGGGVVVRVTLADDIVIAFEDSGIPYNPLAAADPDVTLSAEDREIGGLGIFMVKKLMDAVEYRREDNKNILTVRKTIEG